MWECVSVEQTVLTQCSTCREGGRWSSAKDWGSPLAPVRSHCMCQEKYWGRNKKKKEREIRREVSVSEEDSVFTGKSWSNQRRPLRHIQDCGKNFNYKNVFNKNWVKCTWTKILFNCVKGQLFPTDFVHIHGRIKNFNLSVLSCWHSNSDTEKKNTLQFFFFFNHHHAAKKKLLKLVTHSSWLPAAAAVFIRLFCKCASQ